MDWITFMEKKRAELMNTGHIMDDETFYYTFIELPTTNCIRGSHTHHKRQAQKRYSRNPQKLSKFWRINSKQ